MAEKVATWPEKYGIDGIDLDLEDGAGDTPKAGPNMIHFVRKLRHGLLYYLDMKAELSRGNCYPSSRLETKHFQTRHFEKPHFPFFELQKLD